MIPKHPSWREAGLSQLSAQLEGWCGEELTAFEGILYSRTFKDFQAVSHICDFKLSSRHVKKYKATGEIHFNGMVYLL